MFRIDTSAVEGINGDTAEFEDIDVAKAFAHGAAVEHSVELEVVTDDEDGNPVVAYVATPVEGRNFHPYERVETPAFQAPHIEGYRPAYQRVRIGTVVYRKLDEKGWLVFNTQTGEKIEVATTAKAREITNRMRQEASAA